MGQTSRSMLPPCMLWSGSHSAARDHVSSWLTSCWTWTPRKDSCTWMWPPRWRCALRGMGGARRGHPKLLLDALASRSGFGGLVGSSVVDRMICLVLSSVVAAIDHLLAGLTINDDTQGGDGSRTGDDASSAAAATTSLIRAGRLLPLLSKIRWKSCKASASPAISSLLIGGWCDVLHAVRSMLEWVGVTLSSPFEGLLLQRRCSVQTDPY